MPRRALKLAPRMGSLALTFATPVAAAHLAAVDHADPGSQAERTLPQERPGAVVRGEGGVLDSVDSFRLDPSLEMSLLGDVQATPEYWPTQTTRYRVATISHGLVPSRPQDTSGFIGSFSRTSEQALGPTIDDEYAVGGYYGWRLNPNTVLQGDLQYLRPSEIANHAEDSVVVGFNLRIEF